jgi:3,4-dihydroxy 2-butanone 4-phosphate synthase / GTP cyclohydrolase II
VFPLRANAGGVLGRPGHTEAALDLLELAQETPVGVITELVGDDGIPLHSKGIGDFTRAHGLVVVTVAVVRRARSHDIGGLVTRTGQAAPPLAGERFTAACYASAIDGVDHLALVLGDVATADSDDHGVLVGVPSECLAGDVFGSGRCGGCKEQLEQTIDLIVAEGAG